MVLHRYGVRCLFRPEKEAGKRNECKLNVYSLCTYSLSRSVASSPGSFVRWPRVSPQTQAQRQTGKRKNKRSSAKVNAQAQKRLRKRKNGCASANCCWLVTNTGLCGDETEFVMDVNRKRHVADQLLEASFSIKRAAEQLGKNTDCEPSASEMSDSSGGNTSGGEYVCQWFK